MAVQWLNEAFCLVSSFVEADRFTFGAASRCAPKSATLPSAKPLVAR